MIEKYDAATEPGAKGALLRGEGLYDSHISYWRKAQDSWSLKSSAAAADAVPAVVHKGRRAGEAENERLRKRLGLADDLKLFKDLDGLMSHISHRLHEDIPSVAPFIDIGIETVDGKSILRIDVPMGDKALFRRDRFFVRNNNTTHELKGESLQEYFRRRWRHA